MSSTTTREREGVEVDPVMSMFASSTVAEHVLRGVLGLLLVVAAFALAGRQPLALLLLVPALVAWRGCPTCWLMGLGATLSRGRVSGTCRTPR